MSSAKKVSTAVSFRYAVALIELAEEAGNLDKIEKDLADLAAMIENSADLALLIASPLVDEKKRHAALQALAAKAKLQQLTNNFLGVLSENSRLYALEAIIEAFRSELSRRRGEMTVRVQTAQDLTAKQKKDLQAAISKGVKADISLQATTNPDMLGGMIVTVGSHMIDDSVARKLERLKAAMSKQSNENAIQNIEEVG